MGCSQSVPSHEETLGSRNQSTPNRNANVSPSPMPVKTPPPVPTLASNTKPITKNATSPKNKNAPPKSVSFKLEGQEKLYLDGVGAKYAKAEVKQNSVTREEKDPEKEGNALEEAPKTSKVKPLETEGRELTEAQQTTKETIPEEEEKEEGKERETLGPTETGTENSAKVEWPKGHNSFEYEEATVYRQLVMEAMSDLTVHQAPLSASDKVMVMQGWNKVLAFRTAFSEALLSHWRLIVAADQPGVDSKHAYLLVETNQDPIFLALRERMWDAEDLLVGLLDGAIRGLCPELQVVQREAYHPILDESEITKARSEGLRLECVSMEDHLRLFARCGVQPRHWVLFCDSFMWALTTHMPYAQQDDMEEIERGEMSAYRRAVGQQVALPAVKAYKKLKSTGEDPLYAVAVRRFWERLTQSDKLDFGERFYRTLLTRHPHLLDYFSKTDMDSLAIHLLASLDLIVACVRQLGDCTGVFRSLLSHLGETHRRNGIPTFAYALLGDTLVDCLQPLFEEEERITAKEGDPIKPRQLRTAFLNLYVEVMSLVYYPMLRQERMVGKAREFFDQVKVEFGWSDNQLKNRMLQVEEEIARTGTYTLRSKELEMGARIAWRNSSKCIGRISWNTLQVRDCRHISEPAQIFAEVETHLKLATSGTNIQSIMTVFQPQSPTELFGTRFWSSQYLRYAAYKDTATGEVVMGDPANLALTDYLLEHGYWTPPEPKTAFDVLPLVLKVPGIERPYIYELPQECLFEVDLEHPTRPEITKLGYRWTTVPAISNFKMNIGGVVFQNIPFNGWFVSTEIVRNLMERYGADEKVAEAMGLDLRTDIMWRQNVAYELERTILHSFQKNGFTIVDPMSVGQSLCVHVRREREQHGRECPGQWSWIGGLVGPTNPTWHLEMRDFLIRPQYDYCADGLAFYNCLKAVEETVVAEPPQEKVSPHSGSIAAASGTRVLIVFGSETGNAESVARRLKRMLQLLQPTLMSLNEAAGLEIVRKRSITHVMCVCSTFGKGDPPMNAVQFFKADIQPTPSVKFAVLALGSTLYPDFCHAGIKLEKKLLDAGLDPLMQLTKADAASGADGMIHDWLGMVKQLVLPATLERELLSWIETVSFEPPINRFKWLGNGTTASEMVAGNKLSTAWKCLSNVELLDVEKALRSVRKITLEVPPGENYESGDHLAVYPLNSDAMVNRFFNCFDKELVAYARQNGLPDGASAKEGLEWQTKQLFELEYVEAGDVMPADTAFSTPVTLHTVIKTQLDLSLSTKNIMDLIKVLRRFLDELIAIVDDSKGERDKILSDPLVEKFLGITTAIVDVSSEETTAQLDSITAQYPNIVYFFEDFRGLFFEDFTANVLGWNARNPMVSLAEVLVIFPKLQPRYYSITSSSNASPNEVTITVGVLNTKTSCGVKIEGVCSHFLADLKPGVDTVQANVRTSTFRLPGKADSPLLMVGAGTGLSPMMGFLKDKALAMERGANAGKIHLFFGCRSESEFIYKDVIREYEQSGLLCLHLGLSREPGVPKKYVQHRLKEMGKELSDLLLLEDTHYYVCGDARMADDCFEACINVLRTHGIMSRVAAVHHLTQMRLQGRWQTDVWGIVSHFEVSKKKIEKNKRTAAKIWLNTFG